MKRDALLAFTLQDLGTILGIAKILKALPLHVQVPELLRYLSLMAAHWKIQEAGVREKDHNAEREQAPREIAVVKAPDFLTTEIFTGWCITPSTSMTTLVAGISRRSACSIPTAI